MIFLLLDKYTHIVIYHYIHNIIYCTNYSILYTDIDMKASTRSRRHAKCGSNSYLKSPLGATLHVQVEESFKTAFWKSNVSGHASVWRESFDGQHRDMRQHCDLQAVASSGAVVICAPAPRLKWPHLAPVTGHLCVCVSGVVRISTDGLPHVKQRLVAPGAVSSVSISVDIY